MTCMLSPPFVHLIVRQPLYVSEVIVPPVQLFGSPATVHVAAKAAEAHRSTIIPMRKSFCFILP
jgi:hypothetical protein